MTYEYACTACGHAWEAEQSISSSPLTECPSCHQATAKRQVSGGAGFILKGGGWYADGYGSAKAAPSAEGKSENSDAKPADKKPAAKSGDSAAASGTSATPASTPTTPTPSTPSNTGAASS